MSLSEPCAAGVSIVPGWMLIASDADLISLKSGLVLDSSLLQR